MIRDEELFVRRARAMRLETPPLDAVIAEVARRERGLAPKRRAWHAALAVAACVALVSPLRASRTNDSTPFDDGDACPVRAYTIARNEPVACIAAPLLVCEPEPVVSRP